MAKASKIKFSSGDDMDEDESGDIDESGGSKKKLIIIIIVVLLLAGIGAGVYFWLGSSNSEEELPPGASPEAQAEANISQKGQTSIVKLKEPKYTPPRVYTVNLRDGKHFLKIELVAVLEDPEALLFLNKREPIIDDMIIEYLQNLETKNLRKRGGMDIMKRDLFRMVNSVFTQDFIESSGGDRTPIKKVLVTKFILN